LYLGRHVFEDCSTLLSIHIPSSLQKFLSHCRRSLIVREDMVDNDKHSVICENSTANLARNS
jgi:hypothetical protein